MKRERGRSKSNLTRKKREKVTFWSDKLNTHVEKPRDGVYMWNFLTQEFVRQPPKIENFPYAKWSNKGSKWVQPPTKCENVYWDDVPERWFCSNYKMPCRGGERAWSNEQKKFTCRCPNGRPVWSEWESMDQTGRLRSDTQGGYYCKDKDETIDYYNVGNVETPRQKRSRLQEPQLLEMMEGLTRDYIQTGFSSPSTDKIVEKLNAYIEQEKRKGNPKFVNMDTLTHNDIQSLRNMINPPLQDIVGGREMPINMIISLIQDLYINRGIPIPKSYQDVYKKLSDYVMQNTDLKRYYIDENKLINALERVKIGGRKRKSPQRKSRTIKDAIMLTDQDILSILSGKRRRKPQVKKPVRKRMTSKRRRQLKRRGVSSKKIARRSRKRTRNRSRRRTTRKRKSRKRKSRKRTTRKRTTRKRKSRKRTKRKSRKRK